MKKLYKITLYTLLCVLVLPFAGLLSACGATPSKEALGIYFDTPIYDQSTGLAVFEVDVGVEKKLDYKINPSSWAGYAITYKIEDTLAVNRAYFTFENGVIKVESSKFEDIKISIIVNNYKDTCIIRLKKYPTNMFVYDDNGNACYNSVNVKMNALGSYTIAPYGTFVDLNGDKKVLPLLESDYSFYVTSSDPTILKVIDSDRLKIKSINERKGNEKITVVLKNSAGFDLFKIIINVEIVLNADSSFMMIDGCDGFVSDGGTAQIDASKLQKGANGKYILNYQLFVMSEDDRIIDSQSVEVGCSVNNAQYARVDANNSIIYVEDIPIEKIELKIKFWTNLLSVDGYTYNTTFNIVVNY